MEERKKKREEEQFRKKNSVNQRDVELNINEINVQEKEEKESRHDSEERNDQFQRSYGRQAESSAKKNQRSPPVWEERDEGYHYATGAGANQRKRVPDKSVDEGDPNNSAYKRQLREKMGIIEAKNEPDSAESGSDESNKEQDPDYPRESENPQSNIGRGIYSTAEEVSSIGNDTLANKKKIMEKRVEAPKKKTYEVIDEAESLARE